MTVLPCSTCLKVKPMPLSSNGNASETKANESFDNGVFFDIEANTFESKQIIFEAKRTQYIERKLFSKRSEHVR
jgi:hypothetical protein